MDPIGAMAHVADEGGPRTKRSSTSIGERGDDDDGVVARRGTGRWSTARVLLRHEPSGRSSLEAQRAHEPPADAKQKIEGRSSDGRASSAAHRARLVHVVIEEAGLTGKVAGTIRSIWRFRLHIRSVYPPVDLASIICDLVAASRAAGGFLAAQHVVGTRSGAARRSSAVEEVRRARAGRRRSPVSAPTDRERQRRARTIGHRRARAVAPISVSPCELVVRRTCRRPARRGRRR